MMALQKYQTMQRRRVEVSIQYSKHAGWSACAAEAARTLKGEFPDCRVGVRATPNEPDSDSPSLFCVSVDGMFVAVSRCERVVFLPMQKITTAVERARRQRRPESTVYGQWAPDTRELA